MNIRLAISPLSLCNPPSPLSFTGLMGDNPAYGGLNSYLDLSCFLVGMWYVACGMHITYTGQIIKVRSYVML